MSEKVIMSKLAQAFKAEGDSYLVPCPECGVLIPPNIRGCWSCGHCLDPRLIELAEANGK